jgi:hypothetical protein
MTKDGENNSVFSEWFGKIDAGRRVKSVCKPCWEIKYCPYGPLVEQFPLPEDENAPQRCRIFGHICPVNFVAEPFTETKELRNISRTISRPTQFRVLKRENQVCRKCGQPVADDDIHFDHIIPWSKGGSSDEHNIQLLCSTCNLKKSANFEKEHLVDNFFDHVKDPVDHEIIDFLRFLMKFAHDFHTKEQRYPTADDIAAVMNGGKKEAPEEQGATIISDLVELFSRKRPEELRAKQFRALRERWGFKDGALYTLKFIAEKHDLDLNDFLDAEISLVNRLGWVVSLNKQAKKKWLAS